LFYREISFGKRYNKISYQWTF